MQAEARMLTEQWVSALRSGKYHQIRGNYTNENGLCAVGVLHEIVEAERPSRSITLEIEHEIDFRHIIHMNDCAGQSFYQIAAYIERTLLCSEKSFPAAKLAQTKAPCEAQLSQQYQQAASPPLTTSQNSAPTPKFYKDMGSLTAKALPTVREPVSTSSPPTEPSSSVEPQPVEEAA